MTTLPSLRRKTRRSFFVFIFLYLLLGVFLVAAVLTSSKTSPKMIHINYDSIAAAQQMKEAWVALSQTSPLLEKTKQEWSAEFERALEFEEGNITEPGEKEATQKVRQGWNRFKLTLNQGGQGYQADSKLTENVYQEINRIIQVNETGMFSLAHSNSKLGNRVLVASMIYFLFSLALAVFLADRLSERLSRPLKNIAEILHQRPPLGRPLRLPKPTNLEFLILTTELGYVWERLSAVAKINFEDLLLEKNRVETILDSAEDALLVVDMDGRVTHANQRFLNLIQLPSEQAMNRAWTDLSVMNDNYLRLRQVLHQNLEDGTQVDLVIDGERRNYSARWKVIRGVSGRATGSLFLLHDITEKKQRERFRAEFIDLLSHELKTPLQSLGTASEILCEHKVQLPEDLRLLADTIAEDVERIRAVANEFVTVTQSQSKILKLKLERVAINQLIPEWLKPFHVVAKDRQVKIEFQKEGSDLIFAMIDVVKFPWVISNLVSNAIRFSPPNGTILVYLSDRNSPELEIQVKDDGPGISEEDQKRVFDPFFQAKVPTADGSRGLFGIGLTITKEVVEAHEGRIEYYPRKPRGSEFRIVLPSPPLEFG